MYDGDLCPGQIVKSRAGRDKDRYFVIVDIVDSEHLLLADGDLRKMDKPKKKKTKHVSKMNIVLDSIKEKLEQGEKITNAELRRHLKNLGYL